MNLAPIVIFTYNRPEHTLQTLNSLSKNDLVEDSKLYVFCDGPKSSATSSDLERIAAVHKVIDDISFCKEVVVSKADQNLGLAANVIRGVSSVLQEHEKVIVLEDDLLIGKGFLQYMNTALEKYKEDERIAQVSGFLFPFDNDPRGSCYFLPLANTIGWGTWINRWNKIDFKAGGYEKLKSDRKLRRAFNLDGSYDYTSMLLKQMKNSNFGSWAIIYWWSIFQNKQLVLYPDYPLIQHNDFDHTGQHGGSDKHYTKPDWDDTYLVNSFPEEVVVSENKYNAFKSYIKKYSKYSLHNVLLKIKRIVNVK